MSVYVAPTEPPLVKEVGESSSLPERYGVDILWPTQNFGLVGVQRKELNDLIASMTDGRLSKEIAQMKQLNLAMLLVEGRGSWTTEGKLMHAFRTMEFTKQQLKAFLWSVRGQGVWVEQTSDTMDTIKVLRWFREWSEKDEHKSLKGRPGPRGSWGSVTDRDYAIHVLTSLPGVGPKTAENILDHFGKVPLGWLVSEEELQEVDGVGEVRAERMVEALS